MKICKICKEEKELDLFFRNKNNNDGRHTSCKKCQKDKFKYDSEKRSRNYQKVKERDRLKNSERRKKYYEENREKENIMSKDYKEINRLSVNKKALENYYMKKDTLDFKEKRNLHRKERLKVDIIFRISHYIRTSIGYCLRKNGYSKQSKTEDILGCSYMDFKLYIESKFEDWMNWENRGMFNGQINYGWDIDHIIPVSSAKTEEDIIKLNHYTNLQPLCSYTNRHIKRNL